MSLQVTEIYYNVDRLYQSQADASQEKSKSAIPVITLEQQNLVLGITLLKADGSAYTDIETNDTFQFNADDDYDAASVVLMQTNNAGFNLPGDWASLDVVNGKICLRLDADTAELATALGTNQTLNIFAEIQVTANAQINPKLVLPFSMIARNLINPNGGSPSGNTANYYTKAETDSLLAAKQDVNITINDSVDFKIAQQNTVYTVPAGKLFIPDIGLTICKAFTGGGVAQTGKWLANAIDISDAEASEQAAANDVDYVAFVPAAYPAGTVFKYEVTVASTNTVQSGAAAIRGTLINA